MHLGLIVDGPHVHLHAEGMGLGQEATVDDRDPAGCGRHLGARARRCPGGQAERTAPEPGDALGAERRAQLGAEALLEAGDAGIGE